jgi:hypothetical protein
MGVGRDLASTITWVLGLCLATFAIGWRFAGWSGAAVAVGLVLFVVGVTADLRGV